MGLRRISGLCFWHVLTHHLLQRTVPLLHGRCSPEYLIIIFTLHHEDRIWYYYCERKFGRVKYRVILCCVIITADMLH